MVSDTRYVEIEKVSESEYSLIFDISDLPRGLADLSVDGYILERLIVEYCTDIDFDCSGFEFDPESDYLSIASQYEPLLVSLNEKVKALLTESTLVSSLMSRIEDDSVSPEKWIDEMEYEGCNMNKPTVFDFILEFSTKKSLTEVCMALTKHGFSCYFDDCKQVCAQIELSPDKKTLRSKYDLISEILQDTNSVLSVFTNQIGIEEPLEEIEHWSKYEPT